MSRTPSVLDVRIPWDLIGSVALFLAMIVGAFLLFRVLSSRGLGRQSRFLRVLDRFALNRDCAILVLAIGSRVFAVCIGRDGGSLLCELSPDDLKSAPGRITRPSALSGAPSGEGAQTDPSFGKRFWHNLKLNMGRMPKGTAPMVPSPKASREQAPSRPGADFSAILEAIQTRADEENTNVPNAGTPNVRASSKAPDAVADYHAAVENMRRLAQTDQKNAPAASVPPTVPQTGRGGSMDEDTARELLRVSRDWASDKTPGRPAEADASREGAIDEILDQIAKRQSRYSANQKKRGGGNGGKGRL